MLALIHSTWLLLVAGVGGIRSTNALQLLSRLSQSVAIWGSRDAGTSLPLASCALFWLMGERAKASSSAATPLKIKLAEDASLLEKEDLDPGSSSKRKRQRSGDDIVNKILIDNFKARGWSVESFDLVIREGKSLRETIKDARVRYESAEETMGKVYYDGLRLKFSDAASPMVRMVVVDANEVEDELVSQAIDALLNHRSEKTLMQAIFSANHIPNQKSLVAMYRAVCEIQPHISPANADLFVEMLSYIVRNGLHTKHEQIFDELRPRLDLALEKHWITWKCAGLQPSLWLELHEPYIGAVVNKVAMQKCFDQKTEWMQVSDELAIVVQTAIGSRIFSAKFRALVGLRMSGEIEKIVGRVDTENGTEALVEQLKQVCELMCKDAGKNFYEQFIVPMEIMIMYRGVAFKVPCKSLFEVFVVRIGGKLKVRAVVRQELAPLWCENELCLASAKSQLTVQATLLRPWMLARQAASQLLASEGVTGANIKNILEAKKQMLSGIDKSWMIEHYFFVGMVGDSGEARP